MKPLTVILPTTAVLAALAGGGPAAGMNEPVAGCAIPAKPTLVALTATSATFASAVDPGGTPLHGRFQVGRMLTYPVLLGRGGHGRIAWQATVGTLRPGHRYVVTAHAIGNGCSSGSPRTFSTPSTHPATAVTATIVAARTDAPAAEVTPAAATASDAWAW